MGLPWPTGDLSSISYPFKFKQVFTCSLFPFQLPKSLFLYYIIFFYKCQVPAADFKPAAIYNEKNDGAAAGCI